MKKIIITAISNAKVKKLAEIMRQYFPESEIVSTTDSKNILESVPDDNAPYILITGQALIGGKRGFELIQAAKEKNPNIKSILITSVDPVPSHADYVIKTASPVDVSEKELEILIPKLQ